MYPPRFVNEALRAFGKQLVDGRLDSVSLYSAGPTADFLDLDASRAHFYGVCGRDVYVDPFSELHRLVFVAKLNKTMYGTQDSRNMWQQIWFVTAVAEDQIEIFGKMLPAKFETRRILMIGVAQHRDRELKVLHKSVRVINDELMKIEVDQKETCFSVAGRSRSHPRQYC